MRESTERVYHQKANELIDYISANLQQPHSLGDIAARVMLSERQLLRIMRSALGEPLSAYIARQRVERAVLYMQVDTLSLAELAEMVGYADAPSFSKAFKKLFGIAPISYMDRLKCRVSEYVQLDSCDIDISSEICDFEGLELMYIRILGEYRDEELYKSAWRKLIEFLRENDALTPSTRYIGLSFDDPNVTSATKCRFYAGASISQAILPQGEFGVVKIPAGRYAIYTLKGGCAGLQELYNRINLNFAHIIRHGAAFEEYIDTTAKVYIPIK